MERSLSQSRSSICEPFKSRVLDPQDGLLAFRSPKRIFVSDFMSKSVLRRSKLMSELSGWVLVAYFSPWARTSTRGASATPNAVTLSESLNIALFMEKGAISSRRLDFYLLVHGRLTIVEKGYLSYLQRSLQNDIENIVKTLIEKEKVALKHQQWRDLLIPDKTTHFTSESVKTNILLQSTFNTIKTLEKYLPVLHTSCDSFLSFKSSFYHTLESYVINLILHLKEVAGHTNDTCIIFYEYIAINNAAFLKDRLTSYCDILKGSVCESQNNICHLLTQLTEELVESTFLHLFKYVSCSILFDADSYNFLHSKPFFEVSQIKFLRGLKYTKVMAYYSGLSMDPSKYFGSSPIGRTCAHYSAIADDELVTQTSFVKMWMPQQKVQCALWLTELKSVTHVWNDVIGLPNTLISTPIN
ncbi:uncharacterized protein KIAA0825 [Trichonephila clavipes]|uniref:Uncharacterized protein KIAA0825 n=1 Tax=Trichonephila clavipes TaxID=2585209 RepID=A0A8X7BF51_TRICX|nr:uncharacterized protein KIAA0825 [Trichonephila clavipes]